MILQADKARDIVLCTRVGSPHFGEPLCHECLSFSDPLSLGQPGLDAQNHHIHLKIDR